MWRALAPPILREFQLAEHEDYGWGWLAHCETPLVRGELTVPYRPNNVNNYFMSGEMFIQVIIPFKVFSKFFVV